MEALDKIRAKIGHKITTIYQIVLAEYGYHLLWDMGYLEFHFEDGDLLFLSVAPNGSSLLVENSPWEDVFAGELDESTQKLISEGGKDIKVDVSTIYPFSQFVNSTIEKVYSLYYEDFRQSPCGVQIISGDIVLNFCTLYDRGDISWGANHPSLAKNHLQVVQE
jgi:hypothetical protein